MGSLPAVSIATRIALSAAVCSLIGLLLTGALLIHLFQRHSEQQFDIAMNDDVIHIESSLALDDNGKLHLVTPLETDLYDRRGSGWAWLLEYQGEVLAHSQSLLDGEQLAASLGDYRYFSTLDGVPARGIAAEVQIEGLGEPAILKVAGARAGIDAAVSGFQNIAGLSLGAFAFALVLAALIQVRVSLRPLRSLALSIERMRFGEEKPSPNGWPKEITPLVASLTALQEHNETLVLRGQRQATDLSHTLKTPLAVVQSIAEDLDEPFRGELLTQTRRIREVIERNLTRARAVGGTGRRTLVRPVVEDLALALGRLIGRHRIVLTNSVPETAVFYGISTDLEEMLGNLMENACKWSASRIDIVAQNNENALVIEVRDDGPGVPADKRDAILRRGYRLDETAPGQGIGLPIVIDIAALYHGSFSIETSPHSGMSAVLHLPGRV